MHHEHNGQQVAAPESHNVLLADNVMLMLYVV